MHTYAQVFLMAFVFCIVNGYMQTRALTHAQLYAENWFLDARFGIGVALFFAGMQMNMQVCMHACIHACIYRL